jgi:hypothetical protein
VEKCVKTSWRTLPPPKQKRKMVIHVDLHFYQETAKDEQPFGGSSWRVITVRTKPRGRKVRPITDVTSTTLGKEEMAVHSLKEGAMWHVDPLLACACNRGTVFSVQSVPRCYKQDKSRV